jgi:hypothetical protein
MQFKSFMEALKGKQHKIDKNKNGEIDAQDFKMLQKEESEELDEAEVRVARSDYKVGPSGHKSHKEIVFKDDESKEEMKEAKMSDADMAERERIVKGMKKNLTGFKARYGDRAKEVMYATATKQAMKEETVEEAVQKVDVPAYLRKQQGQTPLKLSDLKRKDTISDKENLAKLRNEELDESVFADKEQAQSVAAKLKSKFEDGNYSVVADKDKHRVVHSYHSDSRVKKDIAKLNEQLDEAMINGREYASHGLMHPDHAARDIHKVSGQSIDFYAHGTGDKVEGKVTKNDGKAVHIKDTKGKTHQFKVQRGLPTQQNEEKKDDVPFDGPYTKTKPAKNSDGTTQQPMSRARELAKQAMKKQMKEHFDIEMTDEQAESILEAIDEQAPVAPVPDRKYIKGTPEHKAYKATKKPINGMPTNVKEEIALDEVESKTVSYGDFISNLLEYETKDGRYVHKGTYGGNYVDPEGADDADDKKPKQHPAEKRGRGRPAGAKSGARKITGTSKLFK